MKHFVSIFLISWLLISCSHHESDVFTQSSGQRFEQIASEYEDILVGQKSGWLMEYYVGNKQIYGGRNIILRFLEGHKVVATSEFLQEEQSSQYTIDAVEGGANPSLIFDTFNDILHKYSIPSAAYPKGMGGDFEFNLYYRDKEFVLIGKKWGNEIRLRPFSGDQQEFFSSIANNNAALHLASFTPIDLQGKSLGMSMDLDNRQVYFTHEGKTLSRAFILTPSGIKLYSPIKIGESLTISELYFNETRSALSSTDGGISTTLCFLAEEINLNEMLWNGYWAQGYVSDNFLEIFDGIRAGETRFYSGNYVSDRDFYLGTRDSWVGIELAKTSHRDREAATFPARYHFDFYAVPNQPRQIDIKVRSSGKNWKFFSDMEPIISALASHSPYEIEDITIGDETYKKLTSTVNEQVWLYLRTENTLPELMTSAWTIDFWNGWMSQNLLTAFGAATSTVYTTDAFATLGWQSKWTSIQFSTKDKNNGSYYCNYLLDLVPVLGDSQSLHIFPRKAGYNFSYFAYLKPVVDAIVAASPYKIVTQGGYTRLIGGESGDTWMYKYVRSN